jgi:hypothetical protein
MSVRLTAEEQEYLHQLAVDAANAELADVDRATSAVRLFLRELRRKYGDEPMLLDIEASYVSEMSEAEQLLLAGYASAERAGDVPNCRLLAMSLAEFYIDDRADRRRAREWIVIASTHLAGASSDDVQELVRLRGAIERRVTGL